MVWVVTAEGQMSKLLGRSRFGTDWIHFSQNIKIKMKVGMKMMRSLRLQIRPLSILLERVESDP